MSSDIQHAAVTSVILLGSTIVLPRISPLSLRQISSTDRPEHPLLTPITAAPKWTMLCVLLGTLAAVLSDARAYARPAGMNGNKLERWAKITAYTAGIAGVLLVTSITLGAPIDIATLLLATHIACLSAMPLLLALGVPQLDDKGIAQRYRLTRLVCDFKPESQMERSLVQPLIGTLVGAWIGAIPAALDWDRPWQSWPLTPAFGSTFGYIAGTWLSRLM